MSLSRKMDILFSVVLMLVAFELRKEGLLIFPILLMASAFVIILAACVQREK